MESALQEIGNAGRVIQREMGNSQGEPQIGHQGN
jgi:hypothetical protein